MYRSRIYAHRGLWNERGIATHLPNSMKALVNAISNGYSVETDIRDFNGGLEIGHDPILSSNFNFQELLDLKGRYALNIKSDGLAPKFKEFLTSENYFLFDMSIPEYQKYLNVNLRTFGRLSEYETTDQYNLASGFWVDGFLSDWWCTNETLEKMSNMDMQFVFVSPELHGRNPDICWKTFGPHFRRTENFALCTDHPDLFLDSL